MKNCFVAPKGWLWCGADFSALEDKISCLLSGDEYKTKEFSEGYDGHALRAAAFFKDELEERGVVVDLNSVESVNSIKDNHGDLRQKAKAPSFALTYSGTWVTIQRTLGCTEEKAKQIEASYHALYSGLAEFAESNKVHAMQHGYVNCAFGMKLRTPLLYAERSSGRLSSKAAAEARSSNNATSQSYGMLMNRAINEFYYKVLGSKYINKIRLINTIHDAVYLLVKAEPEVVKYVNDELIKSMEWQEDPRLVSDKVKLGAELDIGPDWAHQFTMKNNLTIEQVTEFMKNNSLI